jgi:hypothetical protein
MTENNSNEAFVAVMPDLIPSDALAKEQNDEKLDHVQ